MAILDESPSAKIPRLIRDRLAADAGVASFFRRVHLADTYETGGPVLAPELMVVPNEAQVQRTPGGEVSLECRVLLVAVLPAPTPAVPDLNVPSAPVVAAGSAGPLTGTYTYRITEFNSLGESAASDATAVTVSSKFVTWTLPAAQSGSLGFRLWRGEAGKVACRHLVTLRASETAFTDGIPDSMLGDELAPVKFYGERIMDYCASVLYANDWLDESGSHNADVITTCQQGSDTLDTRRNLRLRQMTVTVMTYVDPVSNSIIVGS